MNERRTARRVATGVAAIAGAALVFAIGVGLGQALEQADPAPGTQTLVRTLRPVSAGPAETVTVTVTATNPAPTVTTSGTRSFR